MKMELIVSHFNTDDDISAAVDHFLKDQDADFFKEM